MKPKRFFISWIVATVIMFTMFYLWHGILLNDFTRISYSLDVFLYLSALVYLVIGLIVAVLNTALEYNKKPYARGIIFGIALGFFIYLIAFVLGVSFYADPKIEHIVLDFVWQMVEQGVGSMICAMSYAYMMEKDKLLIH